MPELSRLLAFALASAALIAAPGANVIYILTRGIGQGRRAGIVSALGVETGTAVHITAAALGLSSLVTASPIAFAAVKYAGACYLIYLGVRALLRPSALDVSGTAPTVPLYRVYRDGVLVNVLNPKVALFFLAFLPQFGTTRVQMLIFGAVFFALALASDLVYATAGGVVSAWLRNRPKYLGRQRYILGGTYVGLAALTAI